MKRLSLLLMGLCLAGATIAQTLDNLLAQPLSVQTGPVLGAPDLSALNQPLGPADRLVVQGRHFVRVGPDLQPGTADDRRVRLFGINVADSGAFPDAAQAQAMARHLRSLGFNAVRLHYIDGAPAASGHAPQSVLDTGPFPSLATSPVARLRGLIAALQREGLYINLNLHAGYRFRPDVDQVPALSGNTPLPQDSPALVFHPRLVELQQRYAHDLINALGLQRHAALAMVEILNEASLAHTWQHPNADTWDQQIQGDYRVELTRQWAQWVQGRHGSWAQACASWKSCEDPAHATLVSPHRADQLHALARSGFWGRVQRKLLRWAHAVADGLGLTWVPQPVVAQVHPQVADFLQFVADTDRRYFQQLRTTVREAVGWEVPVTGTQLGYGLMLNRLSHQDMDYLDEHFYVDHPDFPGQAWAPHDWRIRNHGLSDTDLPRLQQLAWLRDPQRPMVISEFNQAWPNRQGAEILPAVTGMALMQDWDGLFLFAYSGDDLAATTPTGFSLLGDWAKLSTVGISAQLFRKIDTNPLPEGHSLLLNKEQINRFSQERDREQLGRWMAQTFGLPPTTPMSTRTGTQLPAGPEASPAAAPTAGTTPPNLSPPLLRHDPLARQLSLQTLDTSAWFGPLLPQRMLPVANGLQLSQPGPGPRYTAVMARTLDGRPWAQTRHWLVAVPAPVSGSQPGASLPRPQALVPYPGGPGWWTLEPAVGAAGPSAPREAQGPLWLSRTPLILHWATGARLAEVHLLDSRGRRMGLLPSHQVRLTAEGLNLQLHQDAASTALWYEVVAQP